MAVLFLDSSFFRLESELRALDYNSHVRFWECLWFLCDNDPECISHSYTTDLNVIKYFVSKRV